MQKIKRMVNTMIFSVAIGVTWSQLFTYWVLCPSLKNVIGCPTKQECKMPRADWVSAVSPGETSGGRWMPRVLQVSLRPPLSKVSARLSYYNLITCSLKGN